MKLPAFEYAAPASLAEAIALLDAGNLAVTLLKRALVGTTQ